MINILAFILIISGSFFLVSSIVGLIRFSSFYNKIHAIGISDSFGSILILLGLALLQNSLLGSCKILLMALLMFVIAPASTNSIVKSYWVYSKKNG